MIIPEQRFRKICRGEYGGLESAKFQEALNSNPGDPLAITFDVGFRETRTIQVPREQAEQYAEWAKEESAPEEALLEYTKPKIHNWIRYNRLIMCDKLRKLVAEHHPERGSEIQIIWPNATPDVIPLETAVKYVEKYG